MQSNNDKKARRTGWIFSIVLCLGGLLASGIGIKQGLIDKVFPVYSEMGFREYIGTVEGGLAIMQGVGMILLGLLLFAGGIAIWYSVCGPGAKKKTGEIQKAKS